MSLLQNLQDSLKNKLNSELALIKTLATHLSNVEKIYQGSDPEQTKDIKKLLNAYPLLSKNISQHIKAIGNIPDLKFGERLKIIFKGEHLIKQLQHTTSGTSILLSTVDVKSSISSSSIESYDIIIKIIEQVQLLNSKNNLENKKRNDVIYPLYVKVLFDSIDVKNIDMELIKDTYRKYPESGNIYSVILSHISRTYPFLGKKLISEIELLKDDVLQVDIKRPSGSSTILLNFMQTYDLMPDGPFRKLDVILAELNLNPTISLDEASRLLSDSKQIGFMIINRIPTSWTQTCRYQIWNLIDADYIKESKLLIDPDYGIDQKTLDSFDTIQIVSNEEIGKKRNFIEIHDKGSSRDRHFYYILENVGELYRILSPWNILPAQKSLTPYIPTSWLDTSMKKHPVIRVQAYNTHFENEVLSYQDVEREFPDIEFEEEVNDTRSNIILALENWFAKSIPTNLDSFQEKLLEDSMEIIVHEQVMVSLDKFNKDKSSEIFITAISVANQLVNRFTREMVALTKSYKSNIFNELNSGELKSRLRTDFKDMVQTIINIIVTDNSLFNIIITKKETIQVLR